MRVHFDHEKKRRLFKGNELQVVVSVYFTVTELAIIEEHSLHQLIVVERKPFVYHDGSGNRQEIDRNIYLGTFLKHVHVEPVFSPTAALAFEQEMLEAFEQLKFYLQGSSSPPQARVYTL